MYTTRVHKAADFDPTIRIGAGGNVYVFCKIKHPLVAVCGAIGKASSSIYWNEKHNCFVFRVKQKAIKERLMKL